MMMRPGLETSELRTDEETGDKNIKYEEVHKMKKVISIILLLGIMMSALVGCSGTSTSVSTSDQSQTLQNIDAIDTIISDIKNALRNGDFTEAYSHAEKSDFTLFIERQTGAEYYTNDGFSAAKGSDGGIMVIFLDVTDGLSADTINGNEYFFSSDYLAEDINTGTPARLLRCEIAEVTSGKYTGNYGEYWFIINDWILFSSENGYMINGGYDGSVTHHSKSGSDTTNYTNGYDGVYMSPEDRMPFPAGEDGPDVSRLTVWNVSGDSASQQSVTQQPAPPEPVISAETIYILLKIKSAAPPTSKH